MGVGGPAKRLAWVRDADDVRRALAGWDGPVWVLGGGSNVVVADEGLPGLVLQPSGKAVAWQADGHVRAEAGVAWDRLVAAAVRRGWAGIECLSGIPGQVGAAPIQNIGAYGQEVANVLVSVSAFDRRTGELRELGAAACDFSYRDSRFKREPDRWLVLAVTLRLRPGGPPALRYAQLVDALAGVRRPSLARVRRTVLGLRRQKGMVLDAGDPDSRSCGSFFTNPVVPPALADQVEQTLGGPMPRYPASGGVKLSAAWLIERCGMTRGWGEGPVGLSRKHTLALVNRGGATAADVWRCAAEVRRRVRQQTGVELEPEPVALAASLAARACVGGLSAPP
jgi:UDP-N-acetylmuramate dehydrogenase